MNGKAVLLPSPADPFLLHYWLQLAERYWLDEVDRLYVYLNSPILTNEDVKKYFLQLFQDLKITVIYEPQQVEHGEAINRLLDIVQEENIMLIEDDCFIFKKGIVDRAFKRIESGEFDILGSKRGSCGMEILKRAKEIWGLDYEGIGDQGCNFWPNLFFTRKEILLDTDRQFCAKLWKAGERIDAIDHVCEEDQAGDTFVNTSLQLRVKNYKIATIPQYHGHPQDIQHYKEKKFLFDGNAPYTHVGSLSSGINGILKDKYGRPLSIYHERPIGMVERNSLDPYIFKTDMEKQELERRVQFFQRFLQERNPNYLDELAELYNLAIERLIDTYGLNRKRIMKRKRIYSTFGL